MDPLAARRCRRRIHPYGRPAALHYCKRRFRRRHGNFVDDPDRISIEKVELLGYCATGTILPSFDQWNRNDVLETQQVVAPTMASPLTYRNPAADFKITTDGTKIEFHVDDDAQDKREDLCPVFSVYTTEYSLAAIGTANPVYARVTVQVNPTDSRIYLLKLASYTNGQPGDNITTLLRNHIYRYEISDISIEGTLTANWVVCPMSEVKITIPSFN